jgi:hypothetical protein
MTTYEDLYRIRWHSIKKDVPYNEEAGILKFWKRHPELGSPLSIELDLEDGTRAQVFANGIVVWKGDHAELLDGKQA